MHLSIIIVKARAALYTAEAHYADGKKGDAAEALESLIVLVHNELTGEPTGPGDEETNPEPDGPEAPDEKPAEGPENKPEEKPGHNIQPV